MYTDNFLRLSGQLTAGPATFAAGIPTNLPTGQSITDTGVSTNTIDLTQHTSITADIGAGKSLYMLWTVSAAFIRAAGALTVIFSILTDDDEALGSPVTLASTGAIAKADLVVGKQIALQIPMQLAGLGLRYLGAGYTFSATADSAGIICDIVETVQDGMKFYPAN